VRGNIAVSLQSRTTANRSKSLSSRGRVFMS
jgi:hypothetical protein